MTACTCPQPFTEDDDACSACEDAWVDGLLAQDADHIPTGDAWDDFARQQG